MVSCGSNNLLYTGNIIGDITCISYLKSINSKANANNRKIIPSFTSFHTLNFLLVSLTKAQINS